jgi:bile acid:Na+ symporter, BASS family
MPRDSMVGAIRIALVVSMGLLVLSLGLRATPEGALYLFKRPRLLVRTMLAMEVVMPLLALLFVAALRLHPAVELALVALAISPVAPILPNRQLKVSEDRDYVYGLFVASAALAVIFTPLLAAVAAHLNGHPQSIGAGRTLKIAVASILLPFVAGMFLRRTWHLRWDRLARLLNRVGSGLVLAAFIPVLILEWPLMRELLGNGTLLMIVLMSALGLLVGHALGGPRLEQRAVLALATTTRHPGMAIAIAAASAPKEALAAPAILLALIVNVLAVTPYVTWCRRKQARALAMPAAHSH